VTWLATSDPIWIFSVEYHIPVLRPSKIHRASLNKRLTLLCGKHKTTTMVKQARWGTADDAKLLQLFRTPHNGVDATKLDVESVKAIHSKFFPEKKYANFAPLYRGKARAFNVSQTLDGHRKRKCTHCCLIRTSRLGTHASSRLKGSKGS
jgi:hypothetical protein